MLIRAYNLREDLSKFFVEFGCEYLKLSKSEWEQVVYMIEIIKPFCIFTKVLSTTKTPTIHHIFSIYNTLFDKLDEAKIKLRNKRIAWKREVLSAVMAAEKKLTQYYSKTPGCLGYLYGKATLLCPMIGDTLFRQRNWEREAHERHELPSAEVYWTSLKEDYDSYKMQYGRPSASDLQSTQTKEKLKGLDDVLRKNKKESSTIDDEFSWYKKHGMLFWA